MVQRDLFSIRQMVDITGLSEFTIRGWESRYSAFQPKRGDTGRRAYSKGDVERAILLRELIKRGYKISKIAPLSQQRLHEVFEQIESSVATDEGAGGRSEVVSRVMELMALQKWPELRQLIRKIPSQDIAALVGDFFVPLLKALSASVEDKTTSISQEHVLSAFLKEKIYSVLSELESCKRSSRSDKGIQFVLATPEGDYHEVGLLLAHLLIRSYGVVSLYLGPHTPARDLAETALRFGASHLLVVSTVSRRQGARQELLSFVMDVRKRLGYHCQILVAGLQAPLVAHSSESSFGKLESFDQLYDYLENLKGR